MFGVALGALSLWLLASVAATAQENGQPANPGYDGSEYRTGNWTELTCDEPAVLGDNLFTPSQRWGMLDCSHAWQDAINTWKTYDRPRARGDRTAFLRSIFDTIEGPKEADCGILHGTKCWSPLTCSSFDQKGTGPAAYMIWISITQVQDIYIEIDFHKNNCELFVNLHLMNSRHVAPVSPPPDPKWLLALIDLITIGTAGVGGLAAHSVDTTSLLIRQGTNLAKDLLEEPKVGDWTSMKQDNFSWTLGEAANAWHNITAASLESLFDGSDSSIDTLTGIISDGKLIYGKLVDYEGVDNSAPEDKYFSSTVSSRILFAFAIPAIWAAAGTFPFVIDSGYPCGTIDPLGTYLSVETMHATASCVDDQLYYLASPKGEAHTFIPHVRGGYYRHNKFSALPGIENLNHGNDYRGLTLDDLVKGAVRTYKQNGGRNLVKGNNAGARDKLISQDLTLEDFIRIGQDITTPGLIRIPVCSPDTALKGWLGPNNVWCRSPITDGNNAFCLGAQNIVDIITDISQFVEDGRVAVKGDMLCSNMIFDLQGNKE
ncbi:hypothetical protein MGYG_02452 [Nannizzia gypsea CBS 118893]|uniref:Ecp2 effector protein domain-containing protein n=1 Tax=Arthroderma gypseum (strain ATCC MYA-4604 / CBS 118893) TaxID=535722 RepID=E4UMM3_ARTGP|nr:hypothetical protein MGYG_02452 [Nannizzia gypsea CBS 118893]EFQ99440.1 hypothetical protein MGYG_02452 [Nannizzia gypsea CBS 118893]